jgi:hypothetical protein
MSKTPLLQLHAPLFALALTIASGCSLKLGVEKESAAIRMRGLADGYASLNALRPYDGTLVEAGILGASGRGGEIVALDVWPIAGAGVGIAGGRLRLLFAEVGLGILFYSPRPESGEIKPPPEEPESTPHAPMAPEASTAAPGSEEGGAPVDTAAVGSGL